MACRRSRYEHEYVRRVERRRTREEDKRFAEQDEQAVDRDDAVDACIVEATVYAVCSTGDDSHESGCSGLLPGYRS